MCLGAAAHCSTSMEASMDHRQQRQRQQQQQRRRSGDGGSGRGGHGCMEEVPLFQPCFGRPACLERLWRQPPWVPRRLWRCRRQCQRLARPPCLPAAPPPPRFNAGRICVMLQRSCDAFNGVCGAGTWCMRDDACTPECPASSAWNGLLSMILPGRSSVSA